MATSVNGTHAPVINQEDAQIIADFVRRGAAANNEVRYVDAARPLDLSLDEITNGRIVIVRGALQFFGMFEEVRACTLKGIASVASQQVAAKVAEAGFERLHEHLSGKQVAALLKRLLQDFAPYSAPLVKKFVSCLSDAPDDIRSSEQAYVRIMMPEDFIAPHRRLFGPSLGHLVVHNPHRDWWFSQCVNMVNMWMAVGRVSRGNSVLIYPDVYVTDLERNGKTVTPRQSVGVPLNFSMEPGDLLLFHGNHLHSSEINITNDTRYVLSMRFTIGPPEYAGDGPRAAYRKLD